MLQELVGTMRHLAQLKPATCSDCGVRCVLACGDLIVAQELEKTQACLVGAFRPCIDRFLLVAATSVF